MKISDKMSFIAKIMQKEVRNSLLNRFFVKTGLENSVFGPVRSIPTTGFGKTGPKGALANVKIFRELSLYF